ncbi:MAG: DUF2141 domain-containing protein [Gammaproteobacteria bacterium]
MNALTIKSILAMSMALMVAGSVVADDTKIRVKVDGFKGATGQAIVSLFQKSDGFPERHQHAFRTRVANISGDHADVEFAGVPKGEYAVSVIHDANNNGEADATWLGVPMEGYGTSGNTTVFYGPPKFSDSKVQVKSPTEVLEIEMRY